MFDFNLFFDETVVEGGASVWLGAIAAFIPALLILGISLTVQYYKEKKRIHKAKIKEEEKIKSDNKKRITYFSEILKISIDYVNNQIVRFEDYAKEIKEDKFEVHTLQREASTDLDRLLRIESGELFFSL